MLPLITRVTVPNDLEPEQLARSDASIDAMNCRPQYE